MSRRALIPLLAVCTLLAAPRAHAQARGGATDVGGQPAKRKLTRMPRLVRFVEAETTTSITASVILTIEISATGKVSNVTIAQSSGDAALDDAAVKAALRFEFEPAEVDDKPAPAKITYRYEFVPPKVEPKPAALEADVRVLGGGLRRERPRVILAPERDASATREARVDDRGHVLFDDLPPGTYEVRVVLDDGTVASRAREELAPGKKLHASYDVVAEAPQHPATAPIEEVEVRGRPRATREVVDYAVRADQGKKIAGTQGDVLKVVQNLPGLSRPPVGSGQIVVWGSSPTDTRVYVDGVDLPALYHGGGLRGTLNSDLVSTIDLVPGAYGAEYGRGLGGLVRVESRTLPRGTHGYVGLDTLDGSAFVSTELHERVRVATAFRYGWLDRVLPLTSAPDVGDYFPIPRYRDAQLKATIDLRRHESVDAVILVSSDALDRTVPSADPSKRRVEGTTSSFWRAYARYTNVSADGHGTTTVTPFFGQDATTRSQRFGETPAKLAVNSDRYGLRASFRSNVIRKRLSVTTGLDTLGTMSHVTREGSLTLPPREGDVSVFGQPPGDEYAIDPFRTHVLDVGPHVHADVKIGPVTVTPGLRLDAFLIEGDKRSTPTPNVPPIGYSRLETAVDPRASARWELTPRVALTAAYGSYHQAPQPEELSTVFGTPALALSRATHITVGESLRITETLSLDVVAFDKRLTDLVVRSRRTNPLRDTLLTQNGVGRSYGVQLFLRQELWRGFFGWASYTISRSTRSFDDEVDSRPFDYDQPHVLSLIASQEIGPWGIGARFRYASGNPRTPVTGSVYDARYDRYDPVFGPHNRSRIPAFWQLDLRVDRSFSLGRSLRALVYADLQNITNRENAEEITYSPDFTKRGFITGLPFIAVVGARMEL